MAKRAPAISLIKLQTQLKLSNETKLVEINDSLKRASSLLIKSEIVAELFKLLYDAPELRFALNKKNLPLIKQLVELKALNARLVYKHGYVVHYT